MIDTIMTFCFQANVSQAEYERAHREYLKRVQLSHDGQEPRRRRDLHVFQAAGRVTSTFAKSIHFEVKSSFAKVNKHLKLIYVAK